MGQALLTIAGRSYRIPARDGDEARITRLGDALSVRAHQLTSALGTLPETQMLVLIALTLADELAEVRGANTPAPPVASMAAPGPAAGPAPDLAQLAALVERLEAIART
jgi:cell division protein ZapA